MTLLDGRITLRSLTFTLLLLGRGDLDDRGRDRDAPSAAPQPRHVAFETTEGTFMSLDVSPDGRRIAFDLLGDLYILPAAGGRAQRVTAGPGWDARPVWSPDGAHLAFLSDRTGREHVWVADAAGRTPPRQLTRSENVSRDLLGIIPAAEWTPDGKHVVAGSFMYSLAGDRVPLPRPDIANPDFPGPFEHRGGVADVRFSADGRYLYYTKYSPEHGTNSVWRYDYETQDAAIFFLPARASFLSAGAASLRVPTIVVSAPVVSPDGRWVAYEALAGAPAGAARGVLRVRNVETGADRTLVGENGPTSGWGGLGTGEEGTPHRARYDFTPDSRALVIGYGGKIHRIELATGRDAIVPFTAQVEQQLDPLVYHTFRVTNESLLVRYIRSVELNPDRTRLVFSALRQLYTMELPGGRPQLLVPQSAGQFQPTISPDARWVAYVTWSDTAYGHLWRIPLAGGVPERLTAVAGYYQRPAWSPDGRAIAVVRGDIKDRYRLSGMYIGVLQLVPVTGDSVRTLADSVRFGHPLSFTPDGQRLRFERVRRVRGQALGLLSSVRIDGTDWRVDVWPGPLRSIGRPQDSTASPLWRSSDDATGLPSPDGRYVAVVKYGNLYLAKIPEQRAATDSAGITVVQVTRDGAYDPVWLDGGKVLAWSFAGTFYRADPMEVLRHGQAPTREVAATGPVALAAGRTLSVPDLTTMPIRLTVPRRVARGTLALRGARVITMRGDEVLTEATVLITDDRVAAVGPASTTAIPAGATVLDVTGKTLIPGLIDLHAHPFVGISSDLLAQNWWELLMNLAYGVTTIRDPSNLGDNGFGYQELIEAGVMTGPRLFGSPAMTPSKYRIESLEDARGYARRHKALGADFIKPHSGWTRQHWQWMIVAAREEQLNITGHVPIEAGASAPNRLNLSLSIDGATGIEHNFLEGERLYADVKRFLAEAGTWYNPASVSAWGGYPEYYREHLHRDPRARTFYLGRLPSIKSSSGHRARGEDGGPPPLMGPSAFSAVDAAAIAQLGGNVSVGSHGNYDGIGTHWEMWALVRGGLSTHDALRAATLQGARALGRAQDLGSIEVGKVADLLVLDRNPLEHIEHSAAIRYVLKNGELYDAATLDALWPQKRPLPPWRPAEE